MKQPISEGRKTAYYLGAALMVIGGPALPTGVSAVQVIAPLSALIQDPDTWVPTLVRRLRQRGVGLTSQQIRGIQDFYQREVARPAPRAAARTTRTVAGASAARNGRAGAPSLVGGATADRALGSPP